MKKPMPLPVTLTDYMLLDQMGYEVIFLNERPVKVIPKGSQMKIVCSAENAINNIRQAFRRLKSRLRGGDRT